MAASKKTGGLAGVTAGDTHLCTVGKEGAGLTYLGYDIYDLADNACFEEVAYLLLHGKLPTQAQGLNGPFGASQYIGTSSTSPAVGHRFNVPAEKTSLETGRTAEEILLHAYLLEQCSKNKGGTAE